MKKFLKTIYSALKPPEFLHVSEWADKYRKLSAEASAEPGNWYTSRAAYQKGIMDAVNDPEIETIVFMKSAQVGATEILLNIIAYFIEHEPAPILLVQPTVDMAQTFSKDRLAPMIRDSERLNNIIQKPKSRESGNTILHKTFNGGHLTMTGANSPANLASRPIRVVLMDEVDRFPPTAGTEGDPVSLAVKRSANFWNRLIVMTSTPTNKDLSRIEAAFNASDQRFFVVPCPDCGTFQRLKWSNVIWETEKTETGKTHKPETALYTCEKCGSLWDDAQRIAALSLGKWEKTADPVDPKMAGFHLNEIYSPWTKLETIVINFLKAKNNPEQLKTFINTSLGESWEDEGETVEGADLYNRREKYAAEVPTGGLVIVAGVDIQDDRIEFEAVAFGAGDESWSVNYQIIYGSPGSNKVWTDLEQALAETYEHETGINLKISCTCIDTGGHFTDETYKFCKKNAANRVFAVKGSSVAGKPIISRPTKNNKFKVKLFTVGTDTAKQTIYSRLKMDEPGAGYMHFPISRDEEYFKQLTAEKIITKYNKGFPRRVWVKTRARNEALDCRVYAMAALAILSPNFEKIAESFEKIDKEIGNIKPQTRHRKNTGWVNKWKK